SKIHDSIQFFPNKISCFKNSQDNYKITENSSNANNNNNSVYSSLVTNTGPNTVGNSTIPIYEGPIDFTCLCDENKTLEEQTDCVKECDEENGQIIDYCLKLDNGKTSFMRYKVVDDGDKDNIIASDHYSIYITGVFH
ncbi:MAG: hypothetical protein MJ252_19280, partial [archaeon]|nr:hypothetical protein [archaeon]